MICRTFAAVLCCAAIAQAFHSPKSLSSGLRSSNTIMAFSSPSSIPPSSSSLPKKDPLDVLDKTSFFCPFETFGVKSLAPASSPRKPLLLYLPGLEASGLTAFVQYPSLAEVFELKCLAVPTSDRSTFPELIKLVRDQLKTYRGRDVFIMGESFGGLLSLGVFLDTVNKPAAGSRSSSSQQIKGIVLVNPATSFNRTLWAKVGPMIAKLRGPLYTLGMLPIGLSLIDAGQIKSTIESAMANMRDPDSRSRMVSLGLSEFQLQFFTNALPVLIKKLDLLPPSTLEWRLSKWLNMGCDLVEPQLHRINAPVLVVAGTVDRLLPSYEEANRLQQELPDCIVHFAHGGGHGGTLDQRTNLTEILKAWKPVASVISPSSPPSKTLTSFFK